MYIKSLDNGISLIVLSSNTYYLTTKQILSIGLFNAGVQVFFELSFYVLQVGENLPR